MAFSEQLKVTVRKRSHLRCCLCHELGVDIHHVVPQSDGGPDTEDNAAALCPSCHDRYGANPEKRKFIREARDLWYEICASRFSSGSQELKEIAESLRHVATKEDLERLALRNVSYVLGASDRKVSAINAPYSFEREQFIHPLIVRELLGWISDPAATIIAVDLTSANRSNRFFGEFSLTVQDARTWVGWVGDKGEYFTYAHVASSPSGVQMVECYDCGGGSGVFGSVGLFSLEHDQALEQDASAKISARPRLILKTLGSMMLGDRYKGKIEYEDGLLVIGPDDGWFNRGREASKALPIK